MAAGLSPCPGVAWERPDSLVTLCPPSLQQPALEEVLEEIRALKETVQAQEKRISDLENKLGQFTNGTD